MTMAPTFPILQRSTLVSVIALLMIIGSGMGLPRRKAWARIAVIGLPGPGVAS